MKKTKKTTTINNLDKLVTLEEVNGYSYDEEKKIIQVYVNTQNVSEKTKDKIGKICGEQKYLITHLLTMFVGVKPI